MVHVITEYVITELEHFFGENAILMKNEFRQFLKFSKNSRLFFKNGFLVFSLSFFRIFSFQTRERKNGICIKVKFFYNHWDPNTVDISGALFISSLSILMNSQ